MEIKNTGRIHTHESPAEFVEMRMQELAVKQLLSRTRSSLQNVTVRLPKGEVLAIDKLATLLDLSRQELLFELIGSAFEQAVQAAAKHLDDTSRDAWVNDIVTTWAAYDVELEGESEQ
jgi:hypothetical protein